MAALVRTLRIEQGVDFQRQVVWKQPDGTPVNLTGYSAVLQVRKTAESADAVLTLHNGSGLTLGGSAGTIDIHATATQTAAIVPLRTGSYDYDLVVTSSDGTKYRLLTGQCYIDKGVSRG